MWSCSATPTITAPPDATRRSAEPSRRSLETPYVVDGVFVSVDDVDGDARRPRPSGRSENPLRARGQRAQRLTRGFPTYTDPMRQRERGRVVAALLSMLVPGAGQIYRGARRPGLLLLGVTAFLAVGAVALVAARPEGVTATLTGGRALGALLVANLALLAFRLFALVDAWRRGLGVASGLAVAALAVLVGVTALPHVAAGYVTVRGYGVLESVFAEEEPRDVLPSRGLFLVPNGVPPAEPAPARPVPVPRGKPLEASNRIVAGSERTFERPWVTILLLGSDAGPGQWGERTDTMILAALQRGTGRTVAFGIPRNLVEVPLPRVPGEPGRRFREPLNALYAWARTRPELFEVGRDPGGTALKQTLSRLLGVRIDYYALVDLEGFANMVDALGGVRIHVKERLVDEVTRPAWGEPKPRIDVHPGRTYHFGGRTALAYVRSRKASNDYTRMARQRCFLGALAQQLDVLEVLRNFRSLAGTVEASVRTDIPLDRVPDLIRLAAATDPRETLTETFGVEFIAHRRARDRYPVADGPRMRAAVRDLLLQPLRAHERGITSQQKAC